MTDSVSFDRAAEFYDRTRGYPPGVAERVGRALLNAADAAPETRILELGVGTGRIALSIVRAGYAYTGIDLSPLMMAKLRAALREIPGAEERVTLIEGDVAQLPFADASFDVVITVHVLHLVADPRRVIAEEARVLARPGIALNGHDDTVDEGNIAPLRQSWRNILHDLGWEPPRQRAGEISALVHEEWQGMGATVDRLVGVEWEEHHSPAEEIEALEQRLWSATWPIPDDLHAEAIRRLRAWAQDFYGAALATPEPRRERFVIERARLL